MEKLEQDLPEGKEDEAPTKVHLYSMRFFTYDSDAFLPDASGRVDMTNYNYSGQKGFIAFDFGYFDSESGRWWHANRAEPRMVVYKSTLVKYSRDMAAFNRQVFVVTISPQERLLPLILENQTH